jgi:hypothetical protein
MSHPFSLLSDSDRGAEQSSQTMFLRFWFCPRGLSPSAKTTGAKPKNKCLFEGAATFWRKVRAEALLGFMPWHGAAGANTLRAPPGGHSLSNRVLTRVTSPPPASSCVTTDIAFLLGWAYM